MKKSLIIGLVIVVLVVVVVGAFIILKNPSSDSGNSQFNELFENDDECTDSDNGKDYYVAGQVNTNQILAVSGEFLSGEDSCNLDEVVEYYCGTNKNLRVETYACPNGCENGACIE